MSIVADDYFVHPLAVCESDRVGSGTRIWASPRLEGGNHSRALQSRRERFC